ncbi:hypothetical protein [Sanguibacter sp. 25GB23B1]|uniref:hypothetical protein n=1 Tax=unclassified Sanguibacter TaxID=2645534 RepID=UPI0032AFBBD8
MKELIVFLLVTIVSVALGFAYAGFVGRRFGLKDWRRWMALAPFWLLAIAMIVTLKRVNMSDPAAQAIQAFAFVCLAQTGLDCLRALRRRRIPEREGNAAPLR